MGYFTVTRSLLWTLLIFLTFCAFAAMADEWIGWVRLAPRVIERQ